MKFWNVTATNAAQNNEEAIALAGTVGFDAPASITADQITVGGNSLIYTDVTTANLVISGKGSVLVRTGDELLDLLRNGQGVLNILPLGGVKDDVDAAIVELFPEVAGIANPDEPQLPFAHAQ